MSIYWCKAVFGAVLLFLTLLPTPSLGQRYDFKSYTTYDGLAQSQPYAILQSKTGYLWIGTDGGGVSRFDGHNFTNFTKKDGLPSDGINAIIEDRKGHLWFATDEGLSRYDGKHFDTVAQDLIVNTLLADRQGKIWIGTLNNGLFRYDGTTATHFAAKDGLPHESVYALYEDARGTLWIGTGAGLCHLEDETFACLSAEDGLASDKVQALAADENGLLWIGTSKGLTLYDPAAETLTPAPQAEVQGVSIETILLASNGMAWIGTDHGLVRLFRQKVMAYTKENGLPKDKVLALHEDREGNVWIGMSSYGLLRFTHGPFVLFDASHGLAQKTVWNIVEDQEQHLWFATNGGGVSRYDGRSFSTFTTADGLADNVVSAIVKDTEGALWFGTEDGISRYDGNRLTTIPGFKESVWSLALDHQGALWIGTAENGLFKYENGHFTRYTTEDGLSDDTIIRIHTDRNGVLWLGTNNGVTRYDGETFSQITVADGLGHKMVFHILDDADGALWFGTYGGGLTRYVPPDNGNAAQTQSYTVEDGLSNDYILSMVFDAEENLWICTNNGLNKVDPSKAPSELHFTTYVTTGGHLPRECNTGAAYQDSYGQLWFGMDEGLVRYTPGEARTNLHAPLTHIENVRLFFEEQDWSFWNTETKKGSGLPASLEIPYHYNHLTFDFVGISLTAPKDVTYQYQLEGLDQTWTPNTQKTHATYANVPPGSYTFKVRAANKEGTWNTEPTTFSFVITPPFWRTPWFYMASLLLCLMGGYGLIRMRENKLKKRQQRLEEMVEERTLALRREKEKVVEVNAKLKQLSLVARETANAMFIADAEGRLEWVNEGFTRMTGYTLETLRRDKGETIEAISGNPAITDAIRRAVERKESTIYEAQFQTIDGRVIWLSSTLTPITDDNGKVHKIVVIDTDITEHKTLAAELIKAREAALNATRTKSDFLANMSHEIRTPMNGVIGMTSLLLDTSLTPEQLEFAQVIRTSSEALLALINDILDFSKIEAGKVELEEHAFEIHTVIEEALDLVTNNATKKTLELSYFVQQEVPMTVHGDVTRVRQVLTNLLSNAVKFTAEGEVVVLVEATPIDAALYEVHFSVRDTGIGIPPERMNRLFQSFSQVDTSTTRKHGGTGLGLTISKRLTELMGGTMSVESELHTGSTFHFSIKVRSAPSIDRKKTTDCAHLQGKRVLIVNVNETTRRMLALHMQRWGMEVRVACSSPEALLWIDADPAFDMVLLDMQMPKMDGPMLAIEIRARQALLPIVTLSSMGQLTPLKKNPFSAWLTKPVKKDRLFDVLTRSLAPEEAAASLQPVTRLFDATMAQTLPLRILLAEDNVVNQKVMQQFLKRLGYRIDIVANGLEVLEALQRNPYDVILMDVQMPEMDGIEATRKIISTYEAHQQPYIMAITANATQKDRQQCIDAGMDDYLSKPVRFEDLVEALQRARPREKYAQARRPVPRRNAPGHAGSDRVFSP